MVDVGLDLVIEVGQRLEVDFVVGVGRACEGEEAADNALLYLREPCLGLEGNSIAHGKQLFGDGLRSKEGFPGIALVILVVAIQLEPQGAVRGGRKLLTLLGPSVEGRIIILGPMIVVPEVGAELSRKIVTKQNLCGPDRL